MGLVTEYSDITIMNDAVLKCKDAIEKMTASDGSCGGEGQSGINGGSMEIMTTRGYGAMMTTKRIPGSIIPMTARTTARPNRLTSFTRISNTFTSDKKRTTRSPMTSMEAGGDAIENEKINECSANMILMIETFTLSLQSKSKDAVSIQKQGMMILKQIKLMKGVIHQNVFSQLSRFTNELSDISGNFEKMIEKVKTTFTQYSQSETKSIEEMELNIKQLDENGQGFVDAEGIAVAESSEVVLQISITKAQKQTFLSTSVMQSIVIIENIGDGFATEEKKEGEISCGALLTKIKSTKELMKKGKMEEVEGMVSEIVYDIQTKFITNIKKSIKQLIRISSDFKEFRNVAKSSLSRFQTAYKSIKGKTLEIILEIDQSSGKVMTKSADGSVTKSTETLMQEMTLQFVQAIKSKNSVSLLKTVIESAKSGGGSSGRKVTFVQFSQTLQEILSLLEQDITSNKIQRLVIRLIKLSKGKFSSSLSSTETEMLSESMTVVEKVMTKTTEFYKSLKSSMKEISGEEVDESSYKIETINESGAILIGGSEQKFAQSKVVIKQNFAKLVMKQNLMSSVIKTITILKTMKGGKEAKKGKSEETKSFNSIISKIESFIKLFDDESSSSETMQELVATIVQYSRLVVGSSKSSSKKLTSLSKTIIEKKITFDQQVVTQKGKIEEKLGSKISIEKLGLTRITESGEIETSTKFEASQIESMNMEYIAYSTASDSLTKLSLVLTEVSSNKGASGDNGETSTAEEFVDLLSILIDLLETSSTEANIQKYCQMLIFMAKGEVEMTGSDLESISAFSEIVTKKTEEIKLSITEIETVYKETFTTEISTIKSTILFISEDGSGFVKGETTDIVQDDETSGVVRVNLKIQNEISLIVKDILQSISLMFGANQHKKKGRTCNNFKRRLTQLKKELDDENPRKKKLKKLRKWFNKKKTLRFCKKSDKTSLKPEMAALKIKRNELISKASLLQEKVFRLEGQDVSKQDESSEITQTSVSSSSSSQQTVSSSSSSSLTSSSSSSF